MLCPKPHSAPSSAPRTWLRPIVSGVSACAPSASELRDHTSPAHRPQTSVAARTDTCKRRFKGRCQPQAYMQLG